MPTLKKLTIVDDPRYLEFVERYAFDLTRFAIEVCNTEPTYQQQEMFDSVSLPGSRTSVSSGHGTGKTAGFAIIALWHLLCYHLSNTILTAPKLNTVADGVWKEFADLSAKIQSGPQAWVRDYFEIESEKVYVKGFKLNWWVIAKTAPRGSPENLAGAHRDWLLFLVDEASGVPDPNFGVITGALTDARNRMCMASQPTRPTGFFYDTHHSLSIDEGGVWVNLIFNSELSPLVSEAFILEKRVQYTKEEYEIKVQGRFPTSSSRFLLGARAIEKCYGRVVVRPDEDYGWLLPMDVGGGGYRDRSTLLALKVTGHGEYGDTARRAQLVSVPLWSNDIAVTELHGKLRDEVRERSNGIGLVDGGGIGLAVIKALEKDDFHNFIKVMWGRPNFANEYKERYVNQRAQAICGLSRAVEEGRFGIDPSVPKNILKQMMREGSRIPYGYDDKARRYIAKKEDMKKEGIPSPDLWDSVSFAYLEDAHYTLSGDVMVPVSVGKAAMLDKLKAKILAAKSAAPA